MDTLAVIGSFTVSEGANVISILTPAQPPPGHVSWSTRDIAAADVAFSQEQPSLAQAFLATGACLVAWKEATFDTTNRNSTDRKEDKELPQ